MVFENAVGYSFLCKSLTRWSRVCPLVEKYKLLFFTGNWKIFQWWLLCSELTISVTTGFKRILKGLKCFPQTHSMFLIFWNKGEINLIFWMEFWNVTFCISDQGHPWDRLLSDLHKNDSPLHFQLPLKISLNLKRKVKGYRVPKG